MRQAKRAFISSVSQLTHVFLGMPPKFLSIEGDEGGVDGEAVALGAVAFDKLLAVAVAEDAAEVLAELAVALAVLDVIDVAACGEVGGGDPAALAFLELGDEAEEEGVESVGEGNPLAVEEDDVPALPGAAAGDVEAIAAEVAVTLVVGKL